VTSQKSVKLTLSTDGTTSAGCPAAGFRKVRRDLRAGAVLGLVNAPARLGL
jgi:hypothetical protein